MAMVHHQLQQTSGKKNPLDLIAKQLRRECQVLCFDEFFISDIGDAMLLANLLKALLKRGLSLVATSNIAIDQLYQDGLQRQRLLPALKLLQQHCDSIHLNGQQDHRHRHLHHHKTYFCRQEGTFNHLFLELNQQSAQAGEIELCHRTLRHLGRHQQCIWFDFEQLCQGYRSALDYIELADRFDTVLLSNIPVLGGETRGWIKARGTEDGVLAIATGERQLNYAPGDDPARRFISLIDECYERKTALYLQAEVELESLYQGGALGFEFRRTASRLVEMQSLEYLQQGRSL